MKNYELIQRLSELPAGYEVEFGRAISKEEMKDDDYSFIGGKVEDIDMCDTDKMITLLC